MYWIN